MNWISLALDRDSWRAVVNTVMNKDVFNLMFIGPCIIVIVEE
jgi:hypothetical protein